MSPRGDCLLRKVDELIDPISGTWDQAILQDNFSPIDVSRILQIPLNIGAIEDFIAWHGTKSGVFSVRSAYHVEWRHQFNGVTCRSLISGTSLNNPTWRILWKLAVPAKVKIHSWRIMHGIIPLKAILFRRHIGTSDLCPICNLEAEDIMHMLFKCQRAAQIWEGLGIMDVIDRATSDGRSGSQALELILKSSQVDVSGYNGLKIQELVAVGCWYIWWLRRRQSHGDHVPPIRHCINSIRAITANAGKAMTRRHLLKKTFG
jgi:hypothetical protein